MLRLVRDEPTDWMEMEEQDLQSDAESADLGGARVRAEGSEAENPAASDARESAGGSPAEPREEARDGAIDSVVDEESDAADAPGSADVAVNLAALEAILLSTHHPLTAGRLAELLDLDSTKPIRKAIKALNTDYHATGRSFRIDQVAGGFQILTLPDLGEYVKKLHQKEGDAKLTKAALETLAIIAYKQPILRAEVEAIRGVACGETIRSLMEKHLVKIAGRAEEPGRPILYGTTKRFLELFGLNSLKELPQPDTNPNK